MPAAVAIPAAISAGTSIFQGVMGSRAAGHAADAQVAAAQRASEIVNAAAKEVNPNIQSQAEQAADWSITNAQNAAAGMDAATGQANQTLGDVYQQILAAIAPYQQGGQSAVQTLTSLLSPDGEFNRNFSMQDFQQDPGYAFRLAEGQKALERSAAARGGLQSGATLKSLAKYSQGVASQEYQNAFNRFQTDRAARFGMLSGLAGFGQTANQQGLTAGLNYGNQVSTNLTDAARYGGNAIIQGGQFAGTAMMDAAARQADNTMRAALFSGDAITGGGNARAAGYIGGANAWGNAAKGISEAGQMFFLRDMMNPRSRVPAGGTPAANINYQNWAKDYFTPKTVPFVPVAPPAL